jgi:hypothetical protein
MVASELRGTENQKNDCGKRQFAGALDVDYRVVTPADDPPYECRLGGSRLSAFAPNS